MTSRTHVILCAVVSLFLGGAAFAEPAGDTSGPATGKNVRPSTAVQKESEGRSNVRDSKTRNDLESGGISAGAPGVESKPGAEGGQAPGRSLRKLQD